MRRFVTLCSLAAVLGCQADALGPPMNASVSALATTMHVQSITGGSFFTTRRQTNNSAWGAVAGVTVVDDQNQPVQGALVSGEWVVGNKSVTDRACRDGLGSSGTDAAGQCRTDVSVQSSVASVTWTVTGITHATLTYNPSANVVSSITVQKPVAP